MIVCTGNDDNFSLYKDSVNDRKVHFHIKDIFNDHWNEFYSKCKNTLSINRPNADKEVRKMINCSLHNLGASIYVCPNDNEVYYCHHTCKGRLCSSCDIKTQNKVTQNILEKCIKVKHRHITFTIPEDLTHWFLEFWTLVIYYIKMLMIHYIPLLMLMLRKIENTPGNTLLFFLLFFILLVDL